HGLDRGEDRAGSGPDRADGRGHRRCRRLRARVPRGQPCLADPGTTDYRRGRGRPRPPRGWAPAVTAAAPLGTSRSQSADAVAPVAEAHDWDAFVAASDPGSYLQLTGWAAVKAVNGWAAVRIEEPDARGGRVGAQVLVRR